MDDTVHVVGKESTSSFRSCTSTLFTTKIISTNLILNGLKELIANLLLATILINTETVINQTHSINMANEMTEKIQNTKKDEPDEYCKIKVNYLTQLKDSTKKLLYIIDEIQSKTVSSKPIPNQYADNCRLPPNECPERINDLLDLSAIKKLEDHAKKLETFEVENPDDDCSVFKRLTGKCHCLNRNEFNDFMIHFNEDTKYNTSNLGEIIKNVRILKKFLYMGDGYTNNALMFLNEGLTKSPHSEKVDIMIACSHADICNVFDDHSFVIVFLMWPYKYDSFGNQTTQMMAARVLYRMAVVEEGRRYLNFNSKITNDIKTALRRKSTEFNTEILEFLNSTMNLLSPSIAPHINATYYCKADEGMTKKIINSLTHFRIYMTVEEVVNALDLLNKLSETFNGRKELRLYLKTIFNVFKLLLMEYDNTQMNVLMTSILNNLMTKTKYEINNIPSRTYMICDMATEPIPVKHEMHQMPSLRNVRIKTTFNPNTKVTKIREQCKTRRRDTDASRNSIKTIQKTANDIIINDVKTPQKPISSIREASKKNFREASKKSFREASKKSLISQKQNAFRRPIIVPIVHQSYSEEEEDSTE